MKYQLFNGEVFSEGDLFIHSSNRGFCYGDGFFESIKVSNGKVPFLQLHYQRLVAACNVLRISIPSEFDLPVFRTEVLRLAKLNNEPNSRIRFQGFRQGSGRYTPESSEFGWVMVSQPIEYSEYRLNKQGLKLGLCETYTINPAPQSSFKSSNSVPYILGGLYAKENGFDDCLLKNVNGNIAEATTSNLFLVSGKHLVVPDLSIGGVAGVMRHVVLQEALAEGLEIKDKPLTKQDILEADEVWLTNASRGIQWVAAFENKRFFKRKAEKLTEHINYKFGLIS